MVDQRRVSQSRHYHVYIKGAVFAGYDQPQTWTNLLAAERHIFTIGDKTIILDHYKDNKKEYVRVMDAGSQNYLQQWLRGRDLHIKNLPLEGLLLSAAWSLEHKALPQTPCKSYKNLNEWINK